MRGKMDYHQLNHMDFMSRTIPIYDYMAARAKLEGKKHELSPEFYSSAFQMGVRLFFGVSVDNAGFPTSDVQNQKAFHQWAARN
jgi:hypothetical protein